MFEKWLLYLSLVHILLIITDNVFFRKWNTGFKRLKEYGDESLSWMQAQEIEVKVNLTEKRIPEEDLFSLHSEPRTILHRPMFSSGSSGWILNIKNFLKHDAIGFERQFVVRQLDTWFQFEKHLLPRIHNRCVDKS